LIRKTRFFFVIYLVFSVLLFSGGKKEEDVLTINIFRCSECNYIEQAANVAEEIHESFNIEVQILDGFLGSFDVIVNGEIIFSKAETGRFPDVGEIEKIIREKYFSD